MCLRMSEELRVRSIAFPVIGTGDLNFPRDVASRIMLEEAASFFQANPDSNVQDIRFVVCQRDHVLTAAFKQEMDKLQVKHKSGPVGRLLRIICAKFTRVSKEDLQGKAKGMNMESMKALSKAVKQASCAQLEVEYNQLGQQSGETAVITSGGIFFYIQAA